ncbi:MAG TPA: hypothetical protein VMC06_00060, partial [Opitutaceae bacterium]|nr:hypothetical protein [Opitutaceae bacterium]
AVTTASGLTAVITCLGCAGVVGTLVANVERAGVGTAKLSVVEGATAAGIGRGATVAGAGAVGLAGRAGWMSPETESFGGNGTEEVAAEVTRPIGSP